MSYIPLDTTDLVIAGLLVALNGLFSVLFSLDLLRQWIIATIRTVLQLTLVGLVLTWLFAAVSPWLTALAAAVMIGAAGFEIRARQKRRLKGYWSYGLGTASMLIASVIVTVFALSTQIRPDPWYHPQFALPILGMVLGNTMTGISLGLNALFDRAYSDRAVIEARLASGADWRSSVGPIAREAMRTGLIPIVNAMMAAGLVSLPGMMTGQILAGVDPIEAAKYQILIMFLIAGGTGLGVLFAIGMGTASLTDARQRLRLERLYVQDAGGRR